MTCLCGKIIAEKKGIPIVLYKKWTSDKDGKIIWAICVHGVEVIKDGKETGIKKVEPAPETEKKQEKGIVEKIKDKVLGEDKKEDSK